jgi:hypothetical protein
MTERSEPDEELNDLLFGRGIYTRSGAPELGLLPRVAPFLSGAAVGTALVAALAIPDESVRLTTLFRLGQRLQATQEQVQDDPRLRGLRQADRDALAGREPPSPPPIPGVPDDRLHQLLAATSKPDSSEEFAGGPQVAVVIRIYMVVRHVGGGSWDYDVHGWLGDRFAECGWDPGLTTLPMAGPPPTAAAPDVDTEQQGAASLQPQPPSQPAAYDDLVRSAFAEVVKPGRLLFNPPDRMQLGQAERVEVRLTRTLELDAELLENLGGPGKPQVEEIPAAPLMAVTLKGDGFRITAYSDEEQSVTPDGITTWEFDIQARKRGQQRLVMSVSLRIPVPGQRLEHKSIPVREATIDVQVGAPALVAHFISSNWQWFIGTAIAIAAVAVAVLHH